MGIRWAVSSVCHKSHDGGGLKLILPHVYIRAPGFRGGSDLPKVIQQSKGVLKPRPSKRTGRTLSTVTPANMI